MQLWIKYHSSGSSGSSGGATAGPASGAPDRPGAPPAGPAGAPLLPLLWYLIRSCSLPYVIYYFIFDLIYYVYQPFYFYIISFAYICAKKSNTALGPKSYCQLAPWMLRPFFGRTAVSSRLVTMGFWRSIRWDRFQGRRSNLQITNEVLYPRHSRKDIF